ncbi:glycolate oxidase subunit GlcF [Exilibacterium tricleocarpae]|uniref:Glycolate oxidase iron-sulfur subunit n=1 Tax=Exilibacterium tricleocarpae TaxID=2591008 RepID=A0A545U9E0_9GAMM|nr:glycolate oxidase subunit GlcF [Exilibacterium tricleocarpae]TQV86059.1 glycolate oxidase subunit GlcF [Exilibacterium tricleocarpae]
MHAKLHHSLESKAAAREAQALLRSCVHCGFCTATCPTYLMLGDERDGPRGRIHLIKQLLEQGEATDKTRLHLDRCLGCRSCETTCPSGVEYDRLAGIGRTLIEQQQARPPWERLQRWGLRQVLPFRHRFTALLRLGQWLRPLLPRSLREKVPPRTTVTAWPARRHQRVMLALAGCVQPGTTPNTNRAAARVLDQLGISLIEVPEAGCCGALSHHLSKPVEGLDFMRRNIDAWWPAVAAGAEAIVMTASGCGSTIKEYGHFLETDPEYAEKARRISALTQDLSEVLDAQDLSRLALRPGSKKVAVHCPCSLQHGQQLPDSIGAVLRKIGVNLARTRDNHLCCGSAGTYSILQPALSRTLLDNKVQALTLDDPDCIATANVGCQLHLASQSPVPVRHWIELVEEMLGA